MEKDERCDDEKVVFNARVNEDEMIITIEEYKNLKSASENFEKVKKEYQAHITYLERTLNEKSNDNEKILSEMRVVNEENRILETRIYKFY